MDTSRTRPSSAGDQNAQHPSRLACVSDLHGLLALHEQVHSEVDTPAPGKRPSRHGLDGAIMFYVT